MEEKFIKHKLNYLSIKYLGMAQNVQNKTCSNYVCLMYCEFGYEVDLNGCILCKCKPDPNKRS